MKSCSGSSKLGTQPAQLNSPPRLLFTAAPPPDPPHPPKWAPRPDDNAMRPSELRPLTHPRFHLGESGPSSAAPSPVTALPRSWHRGKCSRSCLMCKRWTVVRAKRKQCLLFLSNEFSLQNFRLVTDSSVWNLYRIIIVCCTDVHRYVNERICTRGGSKLHFL